MTSWEDPDPAEVLPLLTDSDWKALTGRYENHRERPWRRCLEVARESGARCAVVETRYLDRDYRSEYSAFFSRTFEGVADSAHRVHFFGSALRSDQIWQLPKNRGYLGYVVVRPAPHARVGRTYLAPPPTMRPFVHCAVTAKVSFFGQELAVECVPFAQQDTQFGRCAHVAGWVCHNTAALRGDVSPREMADFSMFAASRVPDHRPLPSQGLTGLELSNLLRDFGLPPIVYQIGDLPTSGREPPVPDHAPDDAPGTWDTRVIAVVCRYLNSAFPVIIGTRHHAFTLIGYRRDSTKSRFDWMSFIRHDDQRGPYLWVADVLNDIDEATSHAYGPWALVIAPVPDKLWLLPEAAERAGRAYLMAYDSEMAAPTFADLEAEGRLTLRTYATSANSFKSVASRRRLGADALREYRLARLPRMVWVVEAIDRRRRRRGEAAVVGEAVFDSTSNDVAPRALIVRVPGALLVAQTSGEVREVAATNHATASANRTRP